MRKVRNEAWTSGMRKRAEEGVSEEGRKTSREVSWGGHWPEIQYIHKPSHNAALAIDTLLLQMKNSEQV